MTGNPENDPLFLTDSNQVFARSAFHDAIDIGLDFKSQEEVRQRDLSEVSPAKFLEGIPEEGKPLNEVVDEFKRDYLPYCYNFSSPNFMGFPDAGNSIAAITGNIVADLLQQNLINQSFCSPSGTFAEINVIQWLRQVVGYETPKNVDSIFDVGGIITPGGTNSNTIGILLARENFAPNTMESGVQDKDHYLVVPKGIGHYSVKSAQMWLGCGHNLIEVETDKFRYDLTDLRAKLGEYAGSIMGLVAYAGDSRTMTVDDMRAVAETTREADPNIWLHADACHGFSLGFSDRLRHKLDGIEEFDSITTDPHKVMNTPYTISSLLVKDPEKLKMASSLSDLIMKEQYAFGQITPFVGSKPWSSLNLWFAMKHIGRSGFGEVIERRHDIACELAEKISADDDFLLLNEVEINSVAFMYAGGSESKDVDTLNQLNRDLHTRILEEGVYHFHQFSIPDDGVIEKGAMLYPLRFMSGNPHITSEHLDKAIEYIRNLGKELES